MNSVISSTEFPYQFPIKKLGNSTTKMNAKIHTSVCIKSEQPKKDGTCSIYINLVYNKNRKKIFLDISVNPISWDKEKGRVKGKSQQAKDFNLLIENKLAAIHKIEMDYRLSGMSLDFETILNYINNPSVNFDFITFWENEMQQQIKFLKPGTYRQQVSSLNKLKQWKSVVPFSDIDKSFIKELELYCKNVLKNRNTTVSTLIKNVKKYIHIANAKGIKTPIDFDEITVKSFKSQRTFLEKREVKFIHKYYTSEFIPDHHKKVLSKFLFSIFTSLRISDIQKITRDNIENDHLIYVSEKTGKINKIQINQSAYLFINKEGKELFNDNYTPEYINRTLKEICTFLGIKKKVSFHVARHTFATNFLVTGGSLVTLQQILDHSNIKETMIYVHLVDQQASNEMMFMDNLLN